MIAEDSVRFAHSGPSHNLLRPAIAELVSCGPLLKIQHENRADCRLKATDITPDFCEDQEQRLLCIHLIISLLNNQHRCYSLFKTIE